MLGIIIPTDFHIFERSWNQQPDKDLLIQSFFLNVNSSLFKILDGFFCRKEIGQYPGIHKMVLGERPTISEKTWVLPSGKLT